MTVKNLQRTLGKGGPEAGALGVGTWAIGGPFFSGTGCRYPTGAPLGYGDVDDKDSIGALHAALDCGVKLFDTADAYGTGHAERILGQALGKRRGGVLVATKFGNTYDVKSRELTGVNVNPDYIVSACKASLERLQTDWIDLYQLHVGGMSPDLADDVANTLDEMCGKGMIRFYCWSTDDPARARLWGTREKAVSVQFDMNVFEDAPGMLSICDELDYAAIIRMPLAMGFLSGKFSPQSILPENDIRHRPPDWLKYFTSGGNADRGWLARLESIKEILASEGRTLAQGALAWVWARNPRTIPIPGIRTREQAKENCAAVQFGPLTPDQMSEISDLLG